MSVADLVRFAETYGYQLRLWVWMSRRVWYADALVLDPPPSGIVVARQRVKSTQHPGGQMDRVAVHTLEELRRVHKAKWRQGQITSGLFRDPGGQ